MEDPEAGTINFVIRFCLLVLTVVAVPAVDLQAQDEELEFEGRSISYWIGELDRGKERASSRGGAGRFGEGVRPCSGGSRTTAVSGCRVV